MRGSLRQVSHCRPFQGIIPAHAGLTVIFGFLWIWFWDHPRACGAHTSQLTRSSMATGSSPRMRGSPTPADTTALETGIIPAHAGLTNPRYNVKCLTWDHPRACGAHACDVPVFLKHQGSSPRMRGSPSPAAAAPMIGGIIPAHAGLTTSRSYARRLNRDHPRACGAHKWYRLFIAKDMGSSPRMRGSPESPLLSCRHPGIIPAHAGLTKSDECVPCESRDHPRACGAHISSSPIRVTKLGSSPRMRGSHARCARPRVLVGIIPAHAGLTHTITTARN